MDIKMTPAARRVLDVADRLFYERGIAQAGVDLIAAEAGVTKKTVYDRFGSKEVLILAYLHERDVRWRCFVEARLVGTPRERILGVFDALGAWMRDHGPRGCSMVNACAELPDRNHPVHEAAAAQKRWTRDLYARLIDEAGYPDPRLADRLLLLHEGAIVAFSVGEAPDAADVARETAESLLPGTT